MSARKSRTPEKVHDPKITHRVLAYSMVLSALTIVLCEYGHAALSTDLQISGEAKVLRREVALLDVPMDGIGEANTNFVPTPAPFTDAVQGQNLIVTGNITHSTAQVKIGKQSGYFGGVAPQRLILSRSSLDLKTNDFTISFWTYLETQTKLFPTFVSDSGNTFLQFFAADNNASKKITLASASNRWLVTNTFYTSGTWVHYAVVRHNNVFTIYQNGTSIGSTTDARRIDLSSMAIGGNSSVNTPLLGYIDDYAMYDYAKWTSDFTPPTEPQTDANLVYLDFEEESINDTVYNNAPTLDKVTGSYFTPTGSGAIRGVEDNAASNGSALYFSGVVGQGLNLTSDRLNLGKQDFTVTFWAKPDKQVSTTPLLFGSSGTGLRFYLSNTGTSNHIALYNDNTILINTGESYTAGTWAHYTLVRHDGIFTLYQNGQIIGENSTYRNLDIDLSKFVIGGLSSVSTSAYKGYLDNFAIYDQALYLRNFTPPQRN